MACNQLLTLSYLALSLGGGLHVSNKEENMTDDNLQRQSRELWQILGNDTEDMFSVMTGFEPCHSIEIQNDAKHQDYFAMNGDILSTDSLD